MSTDILLITLMHCKNVDSAVTCSVELNENYFIEGLPFKNIFTNIFGTMNFSIVCVASCAAISSNSALIELLKIAVNFKCKIKPILDFRYLFGKARGSQNNNAAVWHRHVAVIQGSQ